MATEVTRLDKDWELAGIGDPVPARVPGTVASALHAAGRWTWDDTVDLDAVDWTFRTVFEAAPADDGEEVLLRLGGIATIGEVRLNGTTVLESDSMFLAHELDVTSLLRERNELEIACRALGPRLRERRQPRARWRTKLADNGLRFHRTSLLGRCPGFAPSPPTIGPWRPVELVRRSGAVLEQLQVRPRVDGADGVVSIRGRIRGLEGSVAIVVGGNSVVELTVDSNGAFAGEVRVPDVRRWWPHTHGEPVLYELRVLAGWEELATRRVGFRSLEADGDDPKIRINDVDVFARGAVWTPVDALGLAPSEDELRHALEDVRAAGMNMLRVCGLCAYEEAAFHDLCDELGILVWQDFMFANLDYPIGDDAFRASVEAEARTVLDEIAGRPSLVVLCGNSEVEQQVAMLGLDPELGRGELFGELLPRWAEEAEADAVYVPSSPSGGELPFRPGTGVANYYGVGGYRRPLSDARLAGVRFAGECLAFANVPDERTCDALGPVHHPRWKAGVPRDNGSGWDFEDVRDHYLRELFGVDSSELRRFDHDRYLELSRATTGEVMAEVFGEWRRAGSPCNGGLVLWLRDLRPGAGWGVVQQDGTPKVAWHHLRRALAPVCVWTTDEGLAGIDVHVANDGPSPLAAQLRVALYDGYGNAVDTIAEEVDVEAHGALTRNVEAMLGRFVDVAWAYRFGPPAVQTVVAALESPDGALLSQSVRFPAGRPLEQSTADELGIVAEVRGSAVHISSRRVLYGVRLDIAGVRPDDGAFCVEPRRERVVRLHGEARADGTLSALNLAQPLQLKTRT